VRPLEDRVVPATFTVTNTADAGTGSGNVGDLRYCITQSNATTGPNTIDLTGVTGTITLTSALPGIGQAVTVTGPGASLLTINANSVGGIFSVTTTGTYAFNNVTLTGGRTTASGGAIGAGGVLAASITVSNCVLQGNSSAGLGGAIGVPFGTLTIMNCTIANNTSAAGGGGVSYYDGGSFNVSNCTIVNNVAPEGGGIFADDVAPPTAVVANSTITGNTATNSGGGVFLYQGTGSGTLTFDNSIVAGNSATVGGPDINATATIAAEYSALGTSTGYTLTDLGYNLIGTAAGPLALQLGPLTNYPVPGSSPPRTMPVIPLGGGSAAIGAGDPAQNGTTDELGVARPQQIGANPQPDIGAFERVAGPDAWAPVAILAASDVVTAGGSAYTFIVTYVAGDPVDLTTLGAGNVSVVTPAGVPPVTVTLAGTDTSNPNGVVATYQFVPPGGIWANAANGTYAVMMNPNQVANADGFVPAGPLGMFRVAIPQTFTVTNTNDDTNPGSLRYAMTQANASAFSAIIQFDPALFAAGPANISLLSALPTITDNLTITGPGLGLLTVRRDPSTTGQFSDLVINGSAGVAVDLSGMTISGARNSGISVGVGTLTVSDVAVRGNGRGISVSSGGSLTVSNSTVSGNTGGGISLGGVSSLSLTDSTVSGNGGGGISTSATGSGINIVIQNSTITGNGDGAGGGGLRLDLLGGTALIQNSTITDNTATVTDGSSDGGGIYLEYGTLVLQSTIVAGNMRTPTAAGQDIAIFTYSYPTVTANDCLIGAADGITLGAGSSDNLIGTAAVPLAPLLGPLQNNGGSTETEAPLPGSPVIDRGSNAAGLSTDQTGGPRVYNWPADIGAVESTFPGVPIATTGPTPPVMTAGGTSYQFDVTYQALTAIAVGSLDDNDIVVTGPNGFSTAATFVGVDVNSDGTPRTATYSITPPGGAWTGAADGTYSIVVQGGQVFDTQGNPVTAGTVGAFRVLNPTTLTVTNLADSGPGSLRDVITQADALAPAVVTAVFAPGLTGTISLLTALPAIADNLTVVGPGSGALTIRPAPAASIQSDLTVGGTAGFAVNLSGLTVAGAQGAGFSVTGNLVTLADVVAVGNGVGFAVDGGIVSLADMVAAVNGVGLAVNGGSATVLRGTIANNVMSIGGGGIRVGTGGSLVLADSTVVGNSCGGTSGVGGGLSISATAGAGGVVVLNSTIYGNSAATGGGIGLASGSGTLLLVQNSTVTGNTASSTSAAYGYGGGGIGVPFAGAATIILQSTIVAGNVQANNAARQDLSFSIPASADHCLIGVGTDVTFTSSTDNLIGTSAAPLNPLLAPPDYNGGTTISFAPIPSSPAIDQGSNPAGLTADQTGSHRVQGAAADIGAVEHVPGQPAAVGGPFAMVNGAPGGTSYQFAVTYYDDTAIRVASLDGNDILVTGPNGYSTTATLVSVDCPTDGTPRTATYSIVPPGGSWTGPADGFYSIAVQPNQVFDAAGLAVPATPLGTFQVILSQTLTVTTLADGGPGSLRDAIIQANALAPSVDTILFDPALFTAGPAEILLQSALPAITDGLTITGPGAGLLSVTRDQNAATNFSILAMTASPSQMTAVSGLTITGGTVSGISVGPSNVTLTDVTVSGNTNVGGNGGGILAASGSHLTLHACAVVNNVAKPGSGGGGGIFSKGLLAVEDSDVSNNTAAPGADGGGIDFWGSSLTILSSTVLHNVGGVGGGVYSRGGATLTNSRVSGNYVSMSVFDYTGGGGIAVDGGSLTVQNSIISGNTAGPGTAVIYGFGDDMPALGGGIRALAGTTVVLINSTVSGNTAVDGAGGLGGGIYFGSPPGLSGTVFAGNTGGGVTILDSTIAGNVAPSGGGIGLGRIRGGAILVQNSTVSGNTATATDTTAGHGGGGLAQFSATTTTGTVTLQSTIVAANAAANGRPDLAKGSSGVALTPDHSLLGAADTVTLTGSSANNLTGTTASPLNPLLGPLASYGGSTQTMPLLAGSPALNAGSNPAALATDERGNSRVVGTAPDIGAYEYVPITVTGVQVNDGSAQRSEVRSLAVTFSGPVSFAGGNAAAAFQLQHVQTGDNVNLAAAVSTNAAGQTVVTLTFLPTNVNGVNDTDPVSGSNGGLLSLADGRYQLTVFGAAVSDASLGWALDGDGDGDPSGNYVTLPETAAAATGLHLYRLFGDTTGDGIVDLSDLTVFRTAYNAAVGNPAYLSFLDADNSGVIDLTDLAQFRTRYNHSVF
jgi:hypothetical protein